jgi:predicted MPP superfamily phosphohydrolase
MKVMRCGLKLAIVQLSDIHIKTPEDLVLQRASKIVSAVKNVAPVATAYLLAVTGDIAYSGTKEQYQLAASLCLSLVGGLKSRDTSVLQFFIPGNHDLDFTLQPDTRAALLQHVRKNHENIDPAGETVSQILSVQSNFFDFESTMLKSASRPQKDRLAYHMTFDVAGIKCRVNCFNTAWVSTNPEVPGTFPE